MTLTPKSYFAGYKHDAFLRGAARVAKRTVDEFSSQHQSNFLWACARWRRILLWQFKVQGVGCRV